MTSARGSTASATRPLPFADLTAGAAGAGLFAWATWWVSDPPATFFAAVALLYGAFAVLFLRARPDAFPPPGIGVPNRITLARTSMVVVLGALAVHPDALNLAARWWVVGVGTTAMILDGFDGWAARRTDSASEFGARFDMETDAFLMLVLSVLVWTEGRAGAWVLLIGGMRYLFVAAGWLVPRLAAPLFPSIRRKVVCVVQGAGLLICLGPIIPAPVATGVAAVALASLLWSFGVDTLWLLRR